MFIYIHFLPALTYVNLYLVPACGYLSVFTRLLCLLDCVYMFVFSCVSYPSIIPGPAKVICLCLPVWVYLSFVYHVLCDYLFSVFTYFLLCLPISCACLAFLMSCLVLVLSFLLLCCCPSYCSATCYFSCGCTRPTLITPLIICTMILLLRPR